MKIFGNYYIPSASARTIRVKWETFTSSVSYTPFLLFQPSSTVLMTFLLLFQVTRSWLILQSIRLKWTKEKNGRKKMLNCISWVKNEWKHLGKFLKLSHMECAFLSLTFNMNPSEVHVASQFLLLRTAAG